MPERVRLTVCGGPQGGVNKECWPGEHLTIGRATSASLTVYDVRISREHFRIRRERGNWIVEDLTSQNGTSVNNEPVLFQCQLSDGDRIRAGDSEFKVELETGRVWFRDSASLNSPLRRLRSWIGRWWRSGSDV